MPAKMALKRLTASDLTLFKWHLQHHPAGTQKGCNLNAKILVKALYPKLGEPSPVPKPKYPLDLYLSGPGLATAINLQRKILKEEKNWRLNGEVIDNPVDDSGRYNVLVPGDFALFEFSGDDVPSSAKVLLIASQVPEDAALHAAFMSRFPQGSMWVLEASALLQIIASASPVAGHPLHDWTQSDALEDAALGGSAGTGTINSRSSSRGISPDDFMRARKAAEATGVAGEEFLNAHLEQELQRGSIKDFEWTASVNAISPFDFWLVGPDDEVRLIDAKSTTGKFTNPVHLSFAELQKAVGGPEPYDIYRLYEVTSEGAKMRVAYDIGPALQSILETLKNLPSKVTVDSISVRTDMLDFATKEYVFKAFSDDDQN